MKILNLLVLLASLVAIAAAAGFQLILLVANAVFNGHAVSDHSSHRA